MLIHSITCAVGGKWHCSSGSVDGGGDDRSTGGDVGGATGGVGVGGGSGSDGVGGALEVVLVAAVVL